MMVDMQRWHRFWKCDRVHAGGKGMVCQGRLLVSERTEWWRTVRSPSPPSRLTTQGNQSLEVEKNLAIAGTGGNNPCFFSFSFTAESQNQKESEQEKALKTNQSNSYIF